MKSMTRILALAATGATLVACAARPVASTLKISHGQPVVEDQDGPARRSTVGLYGVGRGIEYTCSATLIGTQTLVTAAHCIVPKAKLYAYFGVDLESAIASGDADAFDQASQTRVQPKYQPLPNSEELTPNDVAVVELTAPAPGGYQPLGLIPSGAKIDQDVLLAGFGQTEQGNDDGLLRSTQSTYIGTDDNGRLEVQDPQQRGACNGDSGGPLYTQVAGVWYVAGALSGGDEPCHGVNLYTSLDQQRDFVTSAVAALAH